MDPALWEMLEGDGDDEVEAILRLRDPGSVPQGVRLVSQFEIIATCRLQRDAIVETRADEAVASLKAPRLLVPDREADSAALESASPEAVPKRDHRRPQIEETGRGVVVGVVDWGCDFAHPNLRHADGATRLLALWDQRRRSASGSPNRYGYGTIHTPESIDHALATEDPYAALGYHPAAGDPFDSGAHGTHVMDIAAGSGRAGGPVGVAPEADLIFVHLATRGTGGLANLGDSVRVLEAVDFILQTAGERPCVINLSMGRHGGPHDGSTLVEQGLDAALTAAPGRAIVQSTGNYFDRRAHAAGQLRPGEERTLIWETDEADTTPNELEVWYSGRDVLAVEVRSPDGALAGRVPLGERASLEADGREVCRIYHRAHDPNNSDHHVDIFLHPGAPPGEWKVTLSGEDVIDGRFHAWVERDAACLHCQSHFAPEDAEPSATTGTICNGFRTIAVGAYDPHSPDRRLATFSSGGPTRDSRQKPDLVAPGEGILAARSAPRNSHAEAPALTRKSGTSMAAPHVTGAVALMFEAAQQPLWINQTRKLLLSSTQSTSVSPEMAARMGSGYLDIERAVDAARSADSFGLPASRWESSLPADRARVNRVEAVMSDQRKEPQLEEWDQELFEEDEDWDEDVAPCDDGECFGENGQDVELTAPFEPGDDWFEAQEDTEDVEPLDPWEPDDGEMMDEEEYLEDKELLAATYSDQDFGAELVALAQEILSAKGSLSSGDLLRRILSQAGIADALSPLGQGSGSFTSPAVMFDVFATTRNPGLRRYYEQLFDLVAEPGALVEHDLRPGDLLVRRALGEGMLGHVAVLASPELRRREELSAEDLRSESNQFGWYAEVVEGGPRPHRLVDTFARLVLDPSGRLPRDQMLLRPKWGTRLSRESSVGRRSAEYVHEEEDFAEARKPRRRWAGCRRYTAKDARLAPDAVSPDYRHLSSSSQSQPFKFTAAHLERFCQLNHFDVTGGQDEVLFGLRGCLIIDDKGGCFATSVVLNEDVYDHFDYHCVLGVWRRSKRQIAVFRGSTVPNWRNMCRQVMSGRRKGVANLLPTGRYLYHVGKHKFVVGAFVLSGKAVVLRSLNNLVYETTDYWDECEPADNIHPGFSPAFAHFSSAGCQTVPGDFCKKCKRHSGTWATFRQRAGLDPDNNRDKWGKPFVYILLTGREARLISSQAAASSLTRLRFGSQGPSVKALQRALTQYGYYGGPINGHMEPAISMAYIEWQQITNNNTADGIVTPREARTLGFSITSRGLASSP